MNGENDINFNIQINNSVHFNMRMFLSFYSVDKIFV